MLGKLFKQINNEQLEPITGMDATFLYVETPTSPMHVGGLAIMEGHLEFEAFRQKLASRIHQMPVLRKRLMQVPLGIDYPYWSDDPYFDLDMHLRRIALPEPGGWAELRETVSSIFSEPLDKSRPLWSITFIEGLHKITDVPENSTGILTKMHHVAIDGMAGAGMISLLFEMSPMEAKLKAPRPYKPAPLPNELELIVRSTSDFAKKPMKLPKIISEVVSSTLKAGFITRAQHAESPTAPFSAPHTPLNGIISARRKWNSAILSLERVKAIRRKMGTTLNDVMLAICAGALRRYLDEKNKLPTQPLVAMMPVSTRGPEGEGETSGNRLSSILVQLATNVADPVERLQVIHENTQRGKSYQKAVGAKTLAKMAQAVPFGIANQAAHLYSRFKMSRHMKPVFNVTITNVPGPPIPLYLNGKKLHTVMGMAPIIDGMGLIITIFSYNGMITVSPTSDARTMPDINVFTRYLRESANELEAAVQAFEKVQEAEQEPHKWVAPKFFNKIKSYLKKNPDATKEVDGVFQFTITAGEEAQYYKLDLNKQPAQVRKSKAGTPDVSFTISDEHLALIVAGELDVPTAVVQGRLKMEGDMEKAMPLAGLLNGLNG